MARIEEISLGDVVETARRYRPVAAVAAVVFVAALIMPAAPRPGGDDAEPFSAGSGPTGLTNATVAAGDDEPEAGSTPPTTAFDNDFSFTPTPPASGSDEGGFSSGGFGAAPSPGSSSGGFTTTTQQERPLRTTVTGWASATGGTPVGSTGVPDQSLPVGNRFGQTDKASFIRLSGTADTLFLKEKPDGSRTTSGAVSVRACQITTAGWKAANNMTFDQAPEYDTTNCTVGTRGSDGVWRFSMAAVADPADDRGLALVPGAGASIDFQVAFESQAVDG